MVCTCVQLLQSNEIKFLLKKKKLTLLIVPYSPEMNEGEPEGNSQVSDQVEDAEMTARLRSILTRMGYSTPAASAGVSFRIICKPYAISNASTFQDGHCVGICRQWSRQIYVFVHSYYGNWLKMLIAYELAIFHQLIVMDCLIEMH